MKTWIACGVLALLVLWPGSHVHAVAPSLQERQAQCIRPWPENPSYWQYRGAPVILLGGSVEDNLFQIPDLEAHLDLLSACGGNYVRNTLSSRDEGNVWPFAQREDGKYDLAQLNEAYYARLQALLDLALARNIIVQFELWDRFDYAMQYWEKNPFRPANNINYSEEESRLRNAYPDHPGGNANPFFRAEPEEENNTLLLGYQQKHIDRVLSISLPYPNVLYCMDNETGANPAWGAYWSGYVQATAAALGVEVYTTEMWDDWDLSAEQHRSTFDHPELYGFVDTSQNNHKRDQEHWDNLQWVRRYLGERPRPINHVKIYGADTGRYGTDVDGLERFWRGLLGGAASVRFHRPDSGLGLSERAQANIRSARMVDAVYAFERAAPGGGALRLEDREDDEAYLSAAPGGACVVYFTDGGAVRLMRDAAGPVVLRWLEIGRSAWQEEVRAEGKEIALKAPGVGPWVVVVGLP
ncbi:MAG: hypothetical protein HYV27_12605 [Candidatus Hydrogenedentes bacterium]|nr:hypothetical protein [Candidatus Hydrogenedentota bacterium]